jgi:hypothetical protein
VTNLLSTQKRDIGVIGTELRAHFRTKWKDESARRYAGGVIRFCEWARESQQQDLLLIE